MSAALPRWSWNATQNAAQQAQTEAVLVRSCAVSLDPPVDSSNPSGLRGLALPRPDKQPGHYAVNRQHPQAQSRGSSGPVVRGLAVVVVVEASFALQTAAKLSEEARLPEEAKL
mmetsp:Transcript_93541/g.171506  ORF Transcript_93541/g.171506 Transcript_93541/m.171506 type:complete len:114 (-) Transcript_93541:117-458(-)